MDRILIRGGRVLSGSIPVSGAKNAALPILCAGLLAPGVLELDNVPQLQDVATMLKLLRHLGVRAERPASQPGVVALDASSIGAPAGRSATTRPSAMQMSRTAPSIPLAGS